VQFEHRPVEDTVRVGAGAIDALLRFFEKGILRIVAYGDHRGLNYGATAQTPGGVDDFGSQGVLDCAS
jgi:hypothetical protein